MALVCFCTSTATVSESTERGPTLHRGGIVEGGEGVGGSDATVLLHHDQRAGRLHREEQPQLTVRPSEPAAAAQEDSTARDEGKAKAVGK